MPRAIESIYLNQEDRDMNRRFSTCLNLEPKLCNLSITGLIVGGICLVIGISFVGLMTSLFSAVTGFAAGTFIGRKWHNGSLQRSNYWGLPFAKILICEKAPESHIRFYH
jgi:hypothetical protein